MSGCQASADKAAEIVRPGILVVFGRIKDRAKFGQYVTQLPDVYRQFGGRYLALAPAPVVQLSGADSADFASVSVVVSIWPSLARIKQFWASDEYQNVAALRAGTGDFMVAALEGIPEPHFANQLAVGQVDLVLLLDPNEVVGEGNADQPIASGAVQPLEGTFPAKTIWLGWLANEPQTLAALRFVFPKLPG